MALKVKLKMNETEAIYLYYKNKIIPPNKLIKDLL